MAALDQVLQETIRRAQQGDTLAHLGTLGRDERHPLPALPHRQLPNLIQRQPGPLQNADEPGVVEGPLVVTAMSRRAAARHEQPDRFPMPEHMRLDTESRGGIADPHVFESGHDSPLYFMSTLSITVPRIPATGQVAGHGVRTESGIMSEPVKTPSLLECCTAAAGLVTGAVRPRRADQRFLRSLTDAGLPTPQRTVRVTALPQAPRSVATPVIVEGVFRPRRITNALTTFVVEHPDATFLVDPSVCVDAEHRALAQLPSLLRALVRPPADTVPTITALHAEPRLPTPDFALPTHAHWDHVCGLLDMPGLPVHMHRAEHEWISSGVVAPVGGVRDSLRERPIVEFDLDGPPMLFFTRSHDLFGDGSIVLVDLAGHTPGSIGVLAHTARGWVLLAGDAAWHTEQIDHIRQKSSFPGNFVDVDREEAFKTLHRLNLARQFATIVPTHDHAASGQLASTGADQADALP